MTTELKEFHISDIVSISSGILVSTRGMTGIYEILSHMAGQELYTHQLPQIGRQAKPVLKEAHPFLNNVIVPTITTEEEAVAFAEDLEGAYGAFHGIPVLESADIPTFAEAISIARQRREDGK